MPGWFAAAWTIDQATRAIISAWVQDIVDLHQEYDRRKAERRTAERRQHEHEH